MFMPCWKVDGGGIDFGEDRLFGEPEIIVPVLSNALGDSPRKSFTRGMTSVIIRSRNSYIRFPRSVTFQSGLLAFADLEVRDRLLGLAAHGLLPGDDRQLLLDLLDLSLALAAGGGELADAHRDHDLLEPRDGELVLVSELLLELRDDLVA
jgi:hypothetical protein